MSADHKAATEWAAHEQKHQECEDSWYSCPLSEEGSADDRNEECNCYAPEINNLKAAYLEARQALLPFVGPASEVTMQDKQRASELIGGKNE